MTNTPRYFAYGSNLNLTDWRRWCHERGYERQADGLRFVSRALLPDRRLGFTRMSDGRGCGVLDVVPARGHVVEGGLFAVDDDTWRLLDRKEGAPVAYRRIPVTAFTDDGRELAAETYEVLPEERVDHVPPDDAYLGVVSAGYEALGLEDTPLREAARGSVGRPQIDGIFAYGTLMRGESRFPVVARYRLLCALIACSEGNLVSLGAYPGMVEGKGRVWGEFLRVEDIAGALTELDAIEGFAGYGSDESLFRRVLVDADIGDGRIRRGWSYRYVGASATEPIVSGDWREHRGVRDAFLASLARCYAAPEAEPLVVDRILDQGPFPALGNRATLIAERLPLVRALADWLVVERDLVVATGRIAVVP
jgi:gamma-glutamylcyclotransferase (GGCT)/AIG2-like uncharacterized protein YtfP